MMKNKTNELKGAARLLYGKLKDLVEALPVGTPLPPARLLKHEYNVGYSVLRRALAALETDGKILIKNKKGIFASGQSEGKKDETVKQEYYSNPWLFSGENKISLCVFKGIYRELWGKIADAFNAHSPMIKIELKDAGEKMMKEISTGSSAFDLAAFPSYLHRRVVVPSSELLEFNPSFKNELELYDYAFDRDKRDSPVTGVCPWLSMSFLTWDRKIFKQKELSFEGTASAYEDIVEKGRILNHLCKKPENTFVFLGYMSHFFRSGLKMKYIQNKPLFPDRKRLSAVIDFFDEVSVKNRISPFCSETYKIYLSPGSRISENNIMRETFADEKFDEEKRGAILMPASADGRHPVFAPVLCASVQTLFPDTCHDFMRFTLSEEAQKIIASALPYLPAARELDPETGGKEKILAMRHAAEKGSVVYKDNIALYEARLIIEMLIEKYLKGQTGGREELFAEMEKNISSYIKKYPKK